MKKLLISAAVAASLSGVAGSAQAATVGQSFLAKVVLTAQCATNNATPADLDFGTYTAFGTATIPAPTTTISFKCTRGVAITGVALDGAVPTIAGLTYGAAIGADSPTPQAAPLPNLHSYIITGSIAAGQAGDTAAAATQTRTLTITY